MAYVFMYFNLSMRRVLGQLAKKLNLRPPTYSNSTIQVASRYLKAVVAEESCNTLIITIQIFHFR